MIENSSSIFSLDYICLEKWPHSRGTSSVSRQSIHVTLLCSETRNNIEKRENVSGASRPMMLAILCPTSTLSGAAVSEAKP
jgi:hypothetical protein